MKMAEMVKARTKAAAEGQDYTPNIAAVFDDKGKFVETVQIEPDGNGGFINSATSEPIESTTVKPLTRQQNQAWSAIIDKHGKTIEEYNAKVADLGNTARLTDEMASLIDPSRGGDPNVLSRAADVAQATDKFFRDSLGGISLVDSFVKDETLNGADIGRLKKAEDQIRQALESGSLSGVAALAAKRAMFEAKATRLAYAHAKAQDQTGKAVAVSEFQRFYDDITGKNNPQVFIKSNQEFLQGQLLDLEAYSESVNSFNADLDNFERQYKFIPFKLMEDPKVMLGDRMKLFEGGSTAPENQPKLDQAKSGETGLPPGYKPAGKSPAGELLFETPDGRIVRKEKK